MRGTVRQKRARRQIPAAAATGARARRRDSVRAHLEQRAAAAPVLVCLDDLHWASPATLAALRALPKDLRRHPVAWLLARSSTPHRDVDYLFGLLEQDGAARVTLAPLDHDAVAAMLTDASGAPPDQGLADLAAGAAGNPALVAELIGGLRDDHAVHVTGGRAVLASARLPRRIHRLAQRRLDGLSQRARHLLVTPAVLVLARPQLPGGVRDQALTAHLQALTGLRDDLAGPAADTVLAAPASTTVTPPRRLASPARSSPGTAARSATRSTCCARRRGTAPGPARMPAMPSRCSRSPPPWSTCATSARPRTSSAPRTIQRWRVSRRRRRCPCCVPASGWPQAGWPTPPPTAGRRWPSPGPSAHTGTPRPRTPC